MITMAVAVSSQNLSNAAWGRHSEAGVPPHYLPQRAPPSSWSPVLVQAPGLSTEKFTVRSRTVRIIYSFKKKKPNSHVGNQSISFSRLHCLWLHKGVSYQWVTDFSNGLSYHVRNEAAWLSIASSIRCYIPFLKQLTASIKRTGSEFLLWIAQRQSLP